MGYETKVIKFIESDSRKPRSIDYAQTNDGFSVTVAYKNAKAEEKQFTFDLTRDEFRTLIKMLNDSDSIVPINDLAKPEEYTKLAYPDDVTVESVSSRMPQKDEVVTVHDSSEVIFVEAPDEVTVHEPSEVTFVEATDDVTVHEPSEVTFVEATDDVTVHEPSEVTFVESINTHPSVHSHETVTIVIPESESSQRLFQQLQSNYSNGEKQKLGELYAQQRIADYQETTGKLPKDRLSYDTMKLCLQTISDNCARATDNPSFLKGFQAEVQTELKRIRNIATDLGYRVPVKKVRPHEAQQEMKSKLQETHGKKMKSEIAGTNKPPSDPPKIK